MFTEPSESRGIRLLFAVAATMAIAACHLAESTVPTPPAQLLVHAVLNPTLREQTVLVERVQNGAVEPPPPSTAFEPGTIRDGIPEAGAIVEIRTPSGATLAAVEVHDTISGRSTGVYSISLDRSGVSLMPGGQYTLRVRTTGGEEVTGTTTIPASPVVVPSPLVIAFNRDRDSLRLRWPQSPTAKRYEVRVSSPWDLPFSEFADSTLVLYGRRRTRLAPVFIPGFRSKASVFALDSNYYDYYRSTNNPFTGTGLISRLHGAIGLFGSVLEVSTQTLDVRADSADAHDGLYRLVSSNSPPNVPTEIFLFVDPPVSNFDYRGLSGSYATAGNPSRDQGLIGSTYSNTVELTFTMNQSIRNYVTRFAGQWSEGGFVGHFEDTTKTVVYARR